MGAILALPFVLLGLWILWLIMFQFFGYGAIAAFVLMAALGWIAYKADEPKRKARWMRKELRLQQDAELAAQWDRLHGHQ